MSIDNNKKKYEVANYISDSGDSIYSAPVEESRGGQIFYSLDAIREIVKEELDRRFGPCKKNMVDENE